MDDNSSPQPAPRYDAYPLDLRALLKLAAVGVVAGVVGWLLTLGITQFFVEPVFCQSPDTYNVCRNGGTLAWISAHVIVLAAMVAVLARLAVYRPLLIVLALFVALWSANAWLGGMEWYIAMLWQALLFGVSTALFGWVARIPNFLVALVVTLLLAIMARVVLVLS